MRQLRRADEIVGKDFGDAIAELIADRGPGRADREVADVMRHEAGAGREDREIGPKPFIRRSWFASIVSRSSSSLIFRFVTFGMTAESLIPAVR
jgi:hypothetical protein